MRKILIALLLSFSAIVVNACDICGCASGASYIGLLPSFQRSFIGIRYESQDFFSKPHDMNDEHYAASHEQFKTTEIWGRYTPFKRIQIFGFIPYHFNDRSEGWVPVHTQGIGDLQFLMNYVIFNTSITSSSRLKQSLQLGAGLKLPTGKSDLVKNGLFVHQNMQTGTGSYDVPVNVIYTMKHKTSGLHGEINYRWNGTNKMGYSFGNKLNGALTFLQWIEHKKLTYLPQFGFNAEHADSDKQNNTFVEYTGGNTVLATAGCDIYQKSLSFGLRLSQPIYQQMGNGYTHGKTRISVSIIYLFKKQH